MAEVDVAENRDAGRRSPLFSDVPEGLCLLIRVAHRPPQDETRDRVEHAELLEICQIRVDVRRRWGFFGGLEEENRPA